MEKYTKLISPKAYTKQQKKAISEVALDNNNEPFGSATYQIQKYPSDLDTHEVIEIKGTRDDAVKFMKKKFLELVDRVYKNKDCFVGETKVGKDDIFEKLNYGYLENGYIRKYDYKKVLNQINFLYDNKIINDNTYKEFIELLKPNDIINVDDFDKLAEYVRNKITLRWNYDDVKRGFKLLDNDRKITLDKAINDEIMFKIDIQCPIGEKYIEISNFFICIYNDENNNYYYLNLPSNYTESFGIGMREEIEDLFFNKQFFNPLKMVKRMFSLSRFEGNEKMVNKLKDLVISEAILLGQIKSEIDTITLVLDNAKGKPPINFFKNQIDNFKPRISHIVNINIDKDKLYNLIDEIYKEKSIDKIKSKLKEIKEHIVLLSYDYLIKELKKKDMIPLDPYFLPEKMKYNYSDFKYYK